MSDALSVAAVTATLHDLIRAAVSTTATGAKVRLGVPREDPPDGEPEVYLHLYRIAPSATLRNRDLPTRRSDGTFDGGHRAAIDLSYVIAFRGNRDLAADRMLGAVVGTLHAHPLLRPEDISAAIGADRYNGLLVDSTLPNQDPKVTLTPESLTLEEMAQLQTLFPESTHRTSLHYRASVVMVGGPS